MLSLLFGPIILPPCPFNQVASLPDFRSSEAQALREGRRSGQSCDRQGGKERLTDKIDRSDSVYRGSEAG